MKITRKNQENGGILHFGGSFELPNHRCFSMDDSYPGTLQDPHVKHPGQVNEVNVLKPLI